MAAAITAVMSAAAREAARASRPHPSTLYPHPKNATRQLQRRRRAAHSGDCAAAASRAVAAAPADFARRGLPPAG
eukprot:CAMPEP_0174694352 /NCGR_PEP_ID=MMETSP1094-20130205/979_1 /TAXON_ID=156173 /ORGANISM="Chrysochromulina brevifilum, Strain UTEX LB 985" /LENGTH=74 /DNA_ID=CAMNT_0015890587 /DNA_START=187 /DNA_END=411 /DNA_ORIENTATION=+